MDDDLYYPTVDSILTIHEDIVREDQETEPGVRSPEVIESALTYISVGYFGEAPRSIHAKAAHLLRLLVAEHPFVDANKRTALNTVVVFYDLNGYEFNYDDRRIRIILKRFASDEGAVEMEEVIAYCRDCTRSGEG